MKKHRVFFLALGLTALMGLTASEGRAETISMTLTVGGGSSFVVDAVATPGSDTYSVSSTGITAINGFLSAQGSEYQFLTLGGGSNFSTASSLGILNASGTIESISGGNAVLTLTETESGFTAPVGPTGTLLSTSTSDLTNSTGSGQTASSTYSNAGPPVVNVTAGPYSVPKFGTSAASVTPVATLYTLTNTVNFTELGGTTTNPIVNGFSITARVAAAAVPEPSTMLTMLTGLPVPLFIAGWLRRRRASA